MLRIELYCNMISFLNDYLLIILLIIINCKICTKWMLYITIISQLLNTWTTYSWHILSLITFFSIDLRFLHAFIYVLGWTGKNPASPNKSAMGMDICTPLVSQYCILSKLKDTNFSLCTFGIGS